MAKVTFYDLTVDQALDIMDLVDEFDLVVNTMRQEKAPGDPSLWRFQILGPRIVLEQIGQHVVPGFDVTRVREES